MNGSFLTGLGLQASLIVAIGPQNAFDSLERGDHRRLGGGEIRVGRHLDEHAGEARQVERERRPYDPAAQGSSPNGHDTFVRWRGEPRPIAGRVEPGPATAGRILIPSLRSMR